jgi:signal transduction histidine kinase
MPPAHQGSGVSILLCRRIATLHGGTISFTNGSGGGLIVALALPRVGWAISR